MSSNPTTADIPLEHQRNRLHLRVVDSVQDYVTQSPRTLIGLRRVTKVFRSSGSGGIAAISELSIDVAESSSIFVTGSSGSGKTTLLGLVGCMIRPTAGRIQVHGRDVTRMPEEMTTDMRRSTFGFVFQSALLIPGMSAISNVMVPALPRREVGSELRSKARMLLERFGLADRAHERVEFLSGGEQQRVSIARALINDPQVVIADEPTAHLGSDDTRVVLDLFSELTAEGRTLLVASHDHRLLDLAHFSRMITLKDGRLISDGR